MEERNKTGSDFDVSFDESLPLRLWYGLVRLYWSWSLARKNLEKSDTSDLLSSVSSYLSLLVTTGEAPLRIRDHAGLLRQNPGTSSRHLQTLAEKRIVNLRPDPSDKRSKIIVLTELGREFIAAQRSENCFILEFVFADLSEFELHDLARLLGDWATPFLFSPLQERPILAGIEQAVMSLFWELRLEKQPACGGNDSFLFCSLMAEISSLGVEKPLCSTTLAENLPFSKRDIQRELHSWEKRQWLALLPRTSSAEPMRYRLTSRGRVALQEEVTLIEHFFREKLGHISYPKGKRLAVLLEKQKAVPNKQALKEDERSLQFLYPGSKNYFLSCEKLGVPEDQRVFEQAVIALFAEEPVAFLACASQADGTADTFFLSRRYPEEESSRLFHRLMMAIL